MLGSEGGTPAPSSSCSPSATGASEGCSVGLWEQPDLSLNPDSSASWLWDFRQDPQPLRDAVSSGILRSSCVVAKGGGSGNRALGVDPGSGTF